MRQHTIKLGSPPRFVTHDRGRQVVFHWGWASARIRTGHHPQLTMQTLDDYQRHHGIGKVTDLRTGTWPDDNRVRGGRG